MKDANLIKSIIRAIKDSDVKTTGYDTTAEVVRIEGNTAWVHIPGGVDETPVKLTIDAKPGETVQVRVSGGSAFLVGNASSPPTDDKRAVQVEQNLNIVQRVVGAVKEVAESAARIARNTNQYFWFTEEGTDTGAHITEIPQKDFLEDPENGGGNLLARSNGIAVRKGLKELATFAEDTIEIGTEEAIAQIYMCARRALMGWSANSGFVIRSLPDLREEAELRLQAKSGDSEPEIIIMAGSSGRWGDTVIALNANAVEVMAESLNIGCPTDITDGDLTIEDGNLFLGMNQTATDIALYDAIEALGWESEVIV